VLKLTETNAQCIHAAAECGKETRIDLYLAFKSVDSLDELVFFIFHWADVFPDLRGVEATGFQWRQLFVILLEWLQQLLVLLHTQPNWRVLDTQNLLFLIVFGILRKTQNAVYIYSQEMWFHWQWTMWLWWNPNNVAYRQLLSID